MNLLTNQRTLCTAQERKKKENKKRRNNNSEGFCGWQARWMMIRKKSDFSIHKEKRKVSKKNKFIHQESFSFNFKNRHAIEYFVYVYFHKVWGTWAPPSFIDLNSQYSHCLIVKDQFFWQFSLFFPHHSSHIFFFSFLLLPSLFFTTSTSSIGALSAAADTFWAQNITRNANCKQQNNSIISWYHTFYRTMSRHYKKNLFDGFTSWEDNQ